VQFFMMEFLDTAPRPAVQQDAWLPPLKSKNKNPRETDWQPLDQRNDLPRESRKIVAVAARCLRRAQSRNQAG
jgi:hypothetical protein